MQLQHIALDRLRDTLVNMRHGKAAPDISDILPSIRSRGILVPLLVRPEADGEGFEVVAGRRRYFAARAVAEVGDVVEPLPCLVSIEVQTVTRCTLTTSTRMLIPGTISMPSKTGTIGRSGRRAAS